MSNENALEKISNLYYHLTSSEKKVSDYVITHQRETQYMSISELADACGVAEATISRFSKRLGYKGFNAFKLAIANSLPNRDSSTNPLSGEVLADDNVPDMCQKLFTADLEAMEHTMSLVRPEAVIAAGDLLMSANKVLCMGQGGSMIMAAEAAHLFSTSFSNYYAVSDSHMQIIAISHLGPQDVILFFSYSGSTREMMNILPQARRKGARIILVTRFLRSPGADLADVVLQCGSNESPIQLGSVAARIAQLYLLDVLFSEVCRRDLENCRLAREKTVDALLDNHI